MDLEQFLGIKPVIFGRNSRYYGMETATLEMSDGRTVTYLRRRIIPPADMAVLAQAYIVSSGDRLDNRASAYYSDPELYWRIADANEAMAPDELTENAGRVLRITS